MHNTRRAWGQQLILDLSGCQEGGLKDEQHIRAWLCELVAAIEMRTFGEPLIEHFATHSHDAAGYTAIQLIETSNIAAHFAENLGEVYIDIFSCKRFDSEIAIDVCRRFFAPQACEKQLIERGARDHSPSRDAA